MKLFEAKQALEECITLQDFNRASVLKEQITELEHTKNDLIKAAAEQAEIKEIRVEKVSSLLVFLSAGYVLKSILCFKRKCSSALSQIHF